MIKKRVQILAGIISLICLLSFSASADVNVYAEGAYTDTDLVVYIYTDVGLEDSPLVSYGVKLTYDTNQVQAPAKESVEKNENVWYFGTSSAPLATPNADPNVTTEGEVVIVGGKINEEDPTEGVSGDRQLIAVVTFDRVAGGPIPTTIGLELGKGGDYANFVQVDGTLLDGGAAPVFDIGGIEIHERGDTNGDGTINILDIGSVKNYMVNGGSVHPWMDCNSDGSINILDMGCVKGIMTQ